MKLFLASEADHPDTIEKLEEFAGGFSNKSIAYIPTAMNGENPYGDWKSIDSTWTLFKSLGANITSVSLEDYKNASVVKELKSKDIIWVTGGSAGYLMYWLRRCELDKHLPGILSSGTIYIGSSAGSMVCAPTLNMAEHYIGEPEPGAAHIPGLGLIDFEIYPHYQEQQHDQIKSIWPSNSGQLYLLKDGEAVVVEDNKIRILGEERIIEK